MVRRTASGFETIGTPEGIERLGGIDFDEAVFAHVRNAVGDGIDRLDPDEPAAQAAVARVRQECIDAKEALSSDTDVSIPVLLPGLQTEVRLTRSEFEAMIRPAISETIVALRRASRSAAVRSEDISAVLLVGGSSRIPLVAQMVGAELGRPIAIDAHPKDAIAFGASIAVAAQRGAATPESVTTVLSDTRPPPPTVSSDPTRVRPAPPGAVAATVAGTQPPLPGGSRPAPPGSGQPGYAPAANRAARAAPTAPARPADPVTGRVQRPAPPTAGGQAVGPTTGPAARPTPPGGGAAAQRPTPPGQAPGFGGPGGPRTAGGGGVHHQSGGFPAPPQRPSAGDNKVLWIALGLVAAVAFVVIMVVTMSGDDGGTSADEGGAGGDDSGYTAAVEQEFIDACVAGAGGGATEQCQCTYDELKANVPFERFAELDRELAAAEPGADLPQELLDAVAACN
jgi:hypothetical protein